MLRLNPLPAQDIMAYIDLFIHTKENLMFKRLFLTAFGLAALTCTASAVNAQPAASGGQTFYVSTSLSDSVGRAADPTIYNMQYLF